MTYNLLSGNKYFNKMMTAQYLRMEWLVDINLYMVWLKYGMIWLFLYLLSILHWYITEVQEGSVVCGNFSTDCFYFLKIGFYFYL